MTGETIRTPAKLNLGLEVVRRREDGYHDLATIFQAVDVFDEMTVEPSPALVYDCLGAVPPELDIARQALFDLGAERGWSGMVRLTKQIPIAAGLGGGSSDAALILRLAALDHSDLDVSSLAGRIGSDVPFFLRGGTALGMGTGDVLKPLPTPRWWFVIATPRIEIEQKTARLFQALEPGDFSDGARVRELANRFESGNPAIPGELSNGFARLMLEHEPVARVWTALGETAGRVALSGAGPSVFSWHASERAATGVADALKDRIDAPVLVARAIGTHSDDSALRAFKRVLTSGGARGTDR